MRKHWQVGSLNYSSIEAAHRAAVEKAESELGTQVPIYECVGAWVVNVPSAVPVTLDPPNIEVGRGSVSEIGREPKPDKVTAWQDEDGSRVRIEREIAPAISVPQRVHEIPREPTPAMLDAGYRAVGDSHYSPTAEKSPWEAA